MVEREVNTAAPRNTALRHAPHGIATQRNEAVHA
jgi:hypothetical protein